MSIVNKYKSEAEEAKRSAEAEAAAQRRREQEEAERDRQYRVQYIRSLLTGSDLHDDGWRLDEGPTFWRLHNESLPWLYYVWRSGYEQVSMDDDGTLGTFVRHTFTPTYWTTLTNP